MIRKNLLVLACVAPLFACGASEATDLDDPTTGAEEVRVAQCPKSVAFDISSFRAFDSVRNAGGADATQRIRAVRDALRNHATIHVKATLASTSTGTCRYRLPTDKANKPSITFQTKSGRNFLNVSLDVGVPNAELRVYAYADSYAPSGIELHEGSIALYAGTSDPGPYADNAYSIIRVGSGVLTE